MDLPVPIRLIVVFLSGRLRSGAETASLGRKSPEWSLEKFTIQILAPPCALLRGTPARELSRERLRRSARHSWSALSRGNFVPPLLAGRWDADRSAYVCGAHTTPTPAPRDSAQRQRKQLPLNSARPLSWPCTLLYPESPRQPLIRAQISLCNFSCRFSRPSMPLFPSRRIVLLEQREIRTWCLDFWKINTAEQRWAMELSKRWSLALGLRRSNAHWIRWILFVKRWNRFLVIQLHEYVSSSLYP